MSSYPDKTTFQQPQQYQPIPPQYQPAPQLAPQGYPVQPQQYYQPGVQNAPQQHQPIPQPVAQQSMYVNALPLQSLNRTSAPVDCPICSQRAMTAISTSYSTQTQYTAVLCFCFCLGCIPYFFESGKDVTHRCAHCGTALAKYRGSGGTEILAHATRAVPMYPTPQR
ncbi:hypothetical protein HK098_006237 [Nowakowskiella sp. JEL0407]|nr:hypothetical protein HK098_006237 [Nowakowskiella sp. JEL0407]